MTSRTVCPSVAIALAVVGCATTPAGDEPADEADARPPLMMFEGVRTTPLEVVELDAREGRAAELAREARHWPARYRAPGATVLEAVKLGEVAGDDGVARSRWRASRVLTGTAVASGAELVLEQPAGDGGDLSICQGLDAPVGATRMIVARAAGHRIGALPALAIAVDGDGQLAYATPVSGANAVRWNRGPVTQTTEVAAEVASW